MFENKISSQGIHYSRYCASWNKEVKYAYGRGTPIKVGMDEWLIEIGLPKDEAREIVNFNINGKLELEESARMTIKKYSTGEELTPRRRGGFQI